MLSQTLCNALEAPPSLTRLRLPFLFKLKQIFQESNGSYNSEANTKHSYETINTCTTPTMSDHNENDNPEATGTQEHPRVRDREQCKAYRQMLAKVTEDTSSRITEEDLRKIFSAPMDKARQNDQHCKQSRDHLGIRSSRAGWLDYWPLDSRQHSPGVTDRVLHEKLSGIPGYAWASKRRQSDGICRYVVRYYRGQGFSLRNYLQDLPFVMTEEKIWQPSGFKLESAPPIQPGSKLYPKSDFSPTLSEEFNGGTVGFIGILDRGRQQKSCSRDCRPRSGWQGCEYVRD